MTDAAGRNGDGVDDDLGSPSLDDSGMRQQLRSDQTDRAHFTVGWCIWTVASAISIVTSKYILLVENYHYPLHLLLVHLLVAALGSTCRTVRYRGRIGVAFSAPAWAVVWKSRKYRGSLEILGIACVAVSLPLAIQAVTHCWNLVTLAMICIIAMPVEAICVRLLSRSIPGAAAAGITSLSILSGVVLLSDEYRLTVNGLVFGLLAILLLAAAKACFDFDNLRNDTYDIRSGPNVTFQAIIWTSFALTACWTLTLEGIWPAILDLRRANIFMLILNVFSSAAMIVTGGCAFYRMPVHSASRGKTVSVRVHILFTTASMACVVGLCSALSLVMIGRSYTTFIQLLAFVSLVATAGLTAMYTSTEMQRPVVDPVPHEMLLHDEQESHDSGSPSAAPGPRKSAERFRDQIGGSQLGPLSTGIVAAAVACLGWWLLSNFGAISYPTIPPNPPPHLDLDYKPTVDLDVVVSLYKEPLSHITTLVNVLKESASFPAQSYRLIIYSKDEDADVDLIKKTTGALNVTKLPNVGREGETYLRHMTQQWDNLAKHTAFLQADVHNIREFRPRFRDYFDPESTGMLSLGFSGVTCDCNDCGDRWGWHDDTKLVPTLYPDVYGGSAECSRALLSYKGQFIASARRIRGVKREVYEELWKAFVDPDSWAHQPEYVKGNTDKMSAPYFGYAVERLWSILMQCSDLDLAWKCPTLLSQTRRGGSKADCQCFDVAQS